MPIRIKNGKPGMYGRITMPEGTYLPDQPFSNPSAAFNGTTNAADGTNPGTLDYNMAQQDVWENNVKPIDWKSFFEKLFYADIDQASQVLGPGAIKLMQAQNNALDQIRNSVATQTQPTNIFEPKLNSPSNSLVGRDIAIGADTLSMTHLQQIFAGKTPQEISDAMVQNGYVRRYEMGVGEFFVRQTAGSGDMTSLTDSRGRPNYVNGASLAPGERVTSSSGVSYVGGTPYTDKAGNTSGQYAITLPGVQNDKHGRYKWTSTVVRDSEGNFVRVYRQQLRKVNTQRARRLREARAEQTQAEQVNTNSGNQLVSLRANYG